MNIRGWEIILLLLIPIGIYLIGFFHGKAVGAKKVYEKQLEKNNKS